MLIGYVRLSKSDGSQMLTSQRGLLLAAGVGAERIYQDLGRLKAGRTREMTEQMMAAGLPA